MSNYAPLLALDKGGAPIQNAPPPSSVLNSTNNENATASQAITFTHDTTLIEIAAVGGPAVMRWVRTSDTQASVISAVTTANFNHVISSNTVRQFVLPREAQGSYMASVQGINRAEGLFRRIAIKSAGGASSVLLTEY